MEPTFPINYRAGWIEPVDEYIPEIMEPKPEWTTTNRLPDYGPVVDDDPQPTHFITDSSKTYQKMQYMEPFHQKHPTTEFINEPHLLDLPISPQNSMHIPQTSSQREPLRLMDTYDDQDIPRRQWQQRKLKGITNVSNLDKFIHELWSDVHKVLSSLPEPTGEEVIHKLQSKLDALPNESTRVDAQDLDDLRDLGVNIPQRVNRSDTVRKTIQRHIDNLEKKNI